MSPRVPVSTEAVAEICRRYQVRKLSLFGSVLRDDFGPTSDVDVLVEFQPSARVGLFKLQDLEDELSRVLGGRRIEVSTPSSLSRYFRDQVLSEAEVQYEQA